MPFAEKLLLNGIDAWVDRWEMQPGDSLVQKIFEAGIGGANAVVVVLSHVSVTKPWVREELDASVVQRIEGVSRLIPILLDADVDVPVAVKHLLYCDVSRLGLDGVVAEVVRTGFGVSSKPPLGSPPGFTSAPRRQVLDDPIDDVVFAAIVQRFRSYGPHAIWFSDLAYEDVALLGVSEQQFLETMEALTSEHRIEAQMMAGRERWQMRGIPGHFWLQEEQREGLDVDVEERHILSEIVNNGIRGGGWDRFGDLHWRTTNAILDRLQRDGLIRVVYTQGGPSVMEVSPLARRRLRS